MSTGPNDAIATEPSGLARLPAPGLEFAFRVEAAVSGPLEVGVVDGGRRRIIPILGGIVRGPKIQTDVLPGGADWQVLRDDSTTSMPAGPAFVDPSTYCFRSTRSFKVADGHYAWLSQCVFVYTGARETSRVILDCYAVG